MKNYLYDARTYLSSPESALVNTYIHLLPLPKKGAISDYDILSTYYMDWQSFVVKIVLTLMSLTILNFNAGLLLNFYDWLYITLVKLMRTFLNEDAFSVFFSQQLQRKMNWSDVSKTMSHGNTHLKKYLDFKWKYFC